MSVVGWILVALPVAWFSYAYALYPALLRLAVGLGLRHRVPRGDAGESVVRGDGDAAPDWPHISVSLPAYNEEASIGRTLDALLAMDYPADRRQILVVSDASSDATDEIVRSYADRGVELLRLERRSGKTAAENAGIERLTGEIVVNTDATIRVPPGSVKPLIRAFRDPGVGVASGRDVSVGSAGEGALHGESGYVGYEMRVRGLETRLGSIVGASGCFYAIRRDLHAIELPEELSRDFAAALNAREAGYRAVSVEEAVCLVPRGRSLRSEYRRKRRTMARGLETLWYKRRLLDPIRYGLFAWMLGSHKLARWMVPLTAPLLPVGLLLLASGFPPALALLAAVVVGTGLGLAALRWPEGSELPRPLAWFGYALTGILAGFGAWGRALGGERDPIWEPTRRHADMRPGGDAAS